MRLIDADALLENGIKVSYGYNDDGIVLIPMGEVRQSIRNAPTIEAEPVRHGKWIDKGLEGDFSWQLDGRGSCWRVLECSACGGKLCGMPGSDFCPRCGAKMDLK